MKPGSNPEVRFKYALQTIRATAENICTTFEKSSNPIESQVVFTLQKYRLITAETLFDKTLKSIVDDLNGCLAIAKKGRLIFATPLETILSSLLDNQMFKPNSVVQLELDYHEYQAAKNTNDNDAVANLKNEFETFKNTQKELLEKNAKLQFDLNVSLIENAKLTDHNKTLEETVLNLTQQVLSITQQKVNNNHPALPNNHVDNKSQFKSVISQPEPKPAQDPQVASDKIERHQSAIESSYGKDFLTVIDKFVQERKKYADKTEFSNLVSVIDDIIFNLFKQVGKKVETIVKECLGSQNQELLTLLNDVDKNLTVQRFSSMHEGVHYNNLRQLYDRGYYIPKDETKFKYFNDEYNKCKKAFQAQATESVINSVNTQLRPAK